MRSAFYALINFINTSKVDDVYSNAAKMILENINKTKWGMTKNISLI